MTWKCGNIGLVAAALAAGWLLGAVAIASAADEPAAPPAGAESKSAAQAPPSAEKPAPPPEAKTPEQPAVPGKAPPAIGIIRQPPSRRYDIPWEKGQALLEDVRDNTYVYDEAAFWWLLGQVAKPEFDGLKPDEECAAYTTLMALPKAYRGQLVTIRGVFVDAEPIHVPVLGLQGKVPRIYVCNVREIRDVQGESPLATVVVIDNPLLYLKPRDTIRVKGYFYKVREYMGTEGRTGHAPMIVARRLEPGESVGTISLPTGGMFSDPYLVAAMAVMLILMTAFIYVRIRVRRKAKANATGKYPFPVHRFRLRRPDRIEPPRASGARSESGGQKP